MVQVDYHTTMFYHVVKEWQTFVLSCCQRMANLCFIMLSKNGKPLFSFIMLSNNGKPLFFHAVKEWQTFALSCCQSMANLCEHSNPTCQTTSNFFEQPNGQGQAVCKSQATVVILEHWIVVDLIAGACMATIPLQGVER